MLTHFKSIPTAHYWKKDLIKRSFREWQRKKMQNDPDIQNQQLKTHKVSALKLCFLLFYPIVHPKMQVASHHPELFARWSFFVRPVGFVLWRAILFLPRSWRVSERSSRFNYPSLRLEFTPRPSERCVSTNFEKRPFGDATRGSVMLQFFCARSFLIWRI